MANKPIPTIEQLRQLLHCDAEAGKLTWRPRPIPDGNGAKSVRLWNGRYAGKPALHFLDKCGRYRGRISGCSLLAHRVIWAMHYGEWPTNDIDHIDGNQANNRLGNLRDVTHGVNMRNLRAHSKNRSGHVGVFEMRNGRWNTYINRAGSRTYLGVYSRKEDAIAARKAAEVRFGFHANHGRT